jgi:hypothetical protein
MRALYRDARTRGGHLVRSYLEVILVLVSSAVVITRTTLYAYVNGDGSVKESGQRLLDAEQPNGTRKTRKRA